MPPTLRKRARCSRSGHAQNSASEESRRSGRRQGLPGVRLRLAGGRRGGVQRPDRAQRLPRDRVPSGRKGATSRRENRRGRTVTSQESKTAARKGAAGQAEDDPSAAVDRKVGTMRAVDTGRKTLRAMAGRAGDRLGAQPSGEAAQSTSVAGDPGDPDGSPARDGASQGSPENGPTDGRREVTEAAWHTRRVNGHERDSLDERAVPARPGGGRPVSGLWVERGGPNGRRALPSDVSHERG